MKYHIRTMSVSRYAALVLLLPIIACNWACAQQDDQGQGVTPPALDAKVIEAAAGTTASVTDDGVVRIGWSRDGVKVTVDGMTFPPTAGLGSWAAFTATDRGAMVMGDTVVFRDEVNPAIDAAFAHGLEVTALHNHFFYDEPGVYFMHIGGHGTPSELARGVRAMWDAIKQVRAQSPEPADRFDGPIPQPGEGRINPLPIEQITGLKASKNPGGVVKVSAGREASMHGANFGGSMGLTTWAAFSGTDELAAMDGDFAMSADEVQPVLRALRKAKINVVALHNHMIGETPGYIFVHFWATGSTRQLADGFKAALDSQNKVKAWHFDGDQTDAIARGFSGAVGQWEVVAEATAPSKGHVLAQLATNSNSTFNVVLVPDTNSRDADINVSFKAVAGKIDQGGGPVWRAKDADNYYIARYNPLEDNYRVYKVVKGRRTELGSADISASPAWHNLRITMIGDHIQGYYDDQKYLDVRDNTFSDPGHVGLWTKADAQTYFDDFRIKILD